ncbi:death-associated protein kinase 1-like [Adelges cooleyi]|uniref:death-associated protein kinase 1-like n=1 Tax=Adelges cooleyi TaxID=133065 RepID=UPI00217F6A11|nr:death-associated protein kinase 1-like [Adelges cooleyi]XP_050423468.1 death-associated protein kinase 1-like [Adelges cooleyi]
MSLLQLLEDGEDENAVKSLISTDGLDNNNLTTQNDEGQTALHLASARGIHNIVDILLKKGANVSSVDLNGNTPLHLASRNGHVSIIKILLNKKPEISVNQNYNGDTALHIACRYGFLKCVAKLVENHIMTIEITNHNLDTPLSVAISEKHEEVALYLLNKIPGNIDTFNNDGNAAIHIAAQEGLLSVVEAIVNLGYSSEYPNGRGLYPLHIATKNGHIDIIRYLCIMGSDPQRRNSDNIKPEIIAIKNNQKDIISLFNKLNNNSAKENYIQQFVISDELVQNTNILLFGQSGAGKSSIIKLMKLGLFSMLLGKSRNTLRTINNNRTFLSQTQCTNGNEIVLTEYVSNTPTYYKHDSTKGIVVQKEKLSGIGDCTFWDFSGEDTYYNSYHHVIQNTPNKIIVIVYNQQQSLAISLKIIQFWLSFVQARLHIPGYIFKNGVSSHLIPVLIVASHSGQKICQQPENNLLTKIKEEYGHVFNVYERIIMFDILAVDSLSIKNIKEAISDCKKRLHTNIPRMNGFCEAVLNFLPKLRRIAHPFPVLSWKTFCDTIHLEVNPLATSQHLEMLLVQLQNHGEILYLKSGLQPDLIVISPSWFGTNIIGTLFSVDFLTSQTRMTGSYQPNDFQSMFPYYDAMSVLQLLETMKLCVQYDNDGDVEYEFPAYIIREKDETLWKPWGNVNDSCYGGVRLNTQPSFVELFTSIFMQIQVELRYLQNNYCEEMDSFLYQWYGGAILCVNNIECMISLEQDNNCIEVKIRGSKTSSYTCFYFLEEILHSINLVLIETCPGMKIIKEFLSPSDLSEHYAQPHGYGIDDVYYSIKSKSKFKSHVTNPLTGKRECIMDLVAFGCELVEDILSSTEDLPLTELSPICRQELSRLIDPVHPLGKDWALFALNIGLDSRVQQFDNEPTSPFLSLIDIWATNQPAPTIGMLIDRLNEIERKEGVLVILQHIQCYRIKTMDINIVP